MFQLPKLFDDYFFLHVSRKMWKGKSLMNDSRLSKIRTGYSGEIYPPLIHERKENRKVLSQREFTT